MSSPNRDWWSPTGRAGACSAATTRPTTARRAACRARSSPPSMLSTASCAARTRSSTAPGARRPARRGARRSTRGRPSSSAGWPRAQRSPRHRRAGRRRAAPRAAAAPAGALHGLDARRLRGAGADRLARAARRLHGGQRGDRRARHLPAAGRAGARGGRAPGRRLPADELHPRRARSTGISTASTCRGCPRTTCARAPPASRCASGSPRRSRAPAALFAETAGVALALAPGMRRGVRMARAVYARVLDRVEGNGYDVLGAPGAPAPVGGGAGGGRAMTCEGGRAGRRGPSADVLVCGASFAGLAVARELAGAGADVLVVDRYEIGARATSACAAPTPWLHAMGVAGAIRRELPAMTFTTPARDGALPPAVELVGLRLPRAVRRGCGRSAATRASSWRRSTGATGLTSTPTAATARRRSWSTRWAGGAS